MKGKIPYGKQQITKEDIQAVASVLQSDYLTQGPSIAEFESAFADYVGSKYAVAVANGTAALHLCTLALNVKPGQKVITTPITFAASANCVRYCGGEVIFGDIDPETYLLDINDVRKMLESAPEGTYSGIIPVDFAGRAVDLEEFRKLADEYGLWIIEDACHAPGGFFIDIEGVHQRCGNGRFADLAIFSFHPVKHIATGEGGMITTNRKELYEKLLILRTHGITRDSQSFENSISEAIGGSAEKAQAMNEYPGWYMEMQTLGFNYRLTDIQAALGYSQLQRADQGLKRRREIAARYYRAFAKIPEISDYNFEPDPGYERALKTGESGHAFHLYVVEVKDRLGLYNYLRERNIYAQIHYIPLHLMPYYKKRNGNRAPLLMHAEGYYNHCISLPMYPTLTREEQQFVIDTINSFYNG